MRPCLLLPLIVSTGALGCATHYPAFPLREPFTVDTDLREVSVACRPDPDKDDPHRMNCAPVPYESPFLWDLLDNLVFARLSRGLSLHTSGEARNINSLDEVPDSAWFTNREPVAAHDDGAPGACTPADVLPPPDEVKQGEWIIDHGKDNGSTLGFRIDVPGKGKYMLKADDEGKPERASAASVIGAAIYDALGYNTTCEQVVWLRKSQLTLTPNLEVYDNEGVGRPFDEAALDLVLKSTTHVSGDLVRMQASKWLPGLVLGPFRYVGTRADDPNDVIEHADRRELRGSRIVAAWLDHWDAREQNSMDVWMAAGKDKRSSPGHVVHYILDTSDTLGGEVGVDDMSRRLGFAYEFDAADIARALLTFGAEERPWDRARREPGEEKFGYFSTREFDPGAWRPLYPNPAFLRMTERDAAWMARKIAKFSPEDVRQLVALGRWAKPADATYLTGVLLERQRRILARYLSKLSPIGDVHADGARICATDFARLRGIAPATTFRYTVAQHSGDRRIVLAPSIGADGEVCFTPRSTITAALPDGDPARRVTIVVRDGTSAGPLYLHLYDLGRRGVKLVGLTREEP